MMKTNAEDTSRLDQSLWALTWPLLLYFFVAFSGPLIDAWFLRQVSDVSVAAVGALWPLFSLVQVIFSSLAQAGCTIAAQYRGAKKYDRVPQIYAVVVALNVVGGALLGLVFWFARHSIPTYLGLEGTAAALASTYLGVLGGGQVVSSTLTAYGTIVVSRGEPRLMFSSALLSASVNIGLNFTFLRMQLWPGEAGSVFAVGLATLIATICTLGLVASSAHRRLGVRLLEGGLGASLRSMPASARRVVSLAVPSLLEPLSYRGAQLVLTVIVAALGVPALAARVYLLNLFVANLMVCLAVSFATQTLIAHQVGERRFDKVNAQFYASLRTGLFVVCTLTACAYLARRPLLEVLVPDPSVRADCLPVFAWALLLEPFRAMNIIGTASLRSTGDVRYSCVVAMLLTWGIGVPACYALSIDLGYGLAGVWMGMVIDEGTRAFANLARWRSGRWREHRLIAEVSVPA